MPVRNPLVAKALEEIADRLEIQDANPFRVRAYRNAARTLQESQVDVRQKAERGEPIAGLPGIGPDLGGKIREIALTGSCELLDRLRGEMPAAITELLEVPGPELDVETPAQVLRALDHPQVRLLAHPTARLIGEREPCDIDMLQVIRKAKACAVHLEVNAQPQRLDLVDAHCRMCRDEGVRVAIDSDAHGAEGFSVLRYGVGQARRGWLARADVLNARSLRQLLPLLRRPGSRRRPAAPVPATVDG